MKISLSIKWFKVRPLAGAMRGNLLLGALTSMVGGGISALEKPEHANAPTVSAARSVYQQRVEAVRQVPGLAAFWDFVLREEGVGGKERFMAYTAAGDEHRYVLEPRNIAWDYWQEGAPATMADFPLLGRGPFGQAVHFVTATTPSALPVLAVSRAALHDSPLDIKGPGQSLSMVVWLIHQEGNHAIAGIWHEGTLTAKGTPAVVKEKGRRQFALFAGMGGNPGGVGAHLSENGVGSFGDIYARHLGVTPEKMKSVKLDASPEELDAGWSVAGFVFDDEKKAVTTYLNGVATECWVDAPAKNRFYKSAEQAWVQARLAKIPGMQPGEDPQFPQDQFYEPPETELLSEKIEVESSEERTVLRTYEYTRVRVTLKRNADGTFVETGAAELAALRTNPYWFGHDLYVPKTIAEGGPFTIGRVIHSGRSGSLTAYIGGVAVYGRALTTLEMQRLARIGTETKGSEEQATLLNYDDLTDGLGEVSGK